MQEDRKPIGRLEPNKTYITKGTILLKAERSIVESCAGRTLEDGTIELLPLDTCGQNDTASPTTDIGFSDSLSTITRAPLADDDRSSR
jgi:hypothetical protein